MGEYYQECVVKNYCTSNCGSNFKDTTVLAGIWLRVEVSTLSQILALYKSH